MQSGQAIEDRHLPIKLPNLLPPPQLRIGRAHAKRQQAQQVAGDAVRLFDHLPKARRFDDQQIGRLHGGDDRRVGFVIEHRQFADAFARQNPAFRAVAVALRSRRDMQGAAQHDVELAATAATVGHGLARAHPRNRAIGEQVAHIVDVAEKLQIFSRVVGISKQRNVFQCRSRSRRG